MNTLDQPVETKMKNIQTKTGRTLDELATIVQRNGFSKHSEIRHGSEVVFICFTNCCTRGHYITA